jgi:DNA-binding NtrC family response regulator
MDGAIQVDSQPGNGTDFNIYLPVEEYLTEKHDTQNSLDIPGGTETILLIDDEGDVLQMEESLLKRMGYNIKPFMDSTKALEAFRSNPDQFDIVVSDITMPGLSGEDLSEKLLQIRPDIPILLCTGFSWSMSKEKALSIGVKGVLLKPIIMKDFATKIRDILDT